eukprot:6214743-Pleurochrysis_carterae.AAC.2
MRTSACALILECGNMYADAFAGSGSGRSPKRSKSIVYMRKSAMLQKTPRKASSFTLRPSLAASC